MFAIAEVAEGDDPHPWGKSLAGLRGLFDQGRGRRDRDCDVVLQGGAGAAFGFGLVLAEAPRARRAGSGFPQ